MKRIAYFIVFFLSVTSIYAAEPQAQSPVTGSPDWQKRVQLNQQELDTVQVELLQQKQFTKKIDETLRKTKQTMSGEFATLREDAQLSSEKIAETFAKFQKLEQQLLVLADEVAQQKSLLSQQSDSIATINKLMPEQTAAINSMLHQHSAQIDTLSHSIADNKAELAMRITEVNSGVDAAQKGLNSLDQNMGNKVSQLTYWLALVAIIGGIGVAIGIMLRKNLSSSSNQLENNISQVRLKMEEENIQLDTKLVEVLQGQMKLAQEQQPAATNLVNEELDHTLQLKVGEEIFRMRLRLNALPQDTKGLKPLMKSLERLEEEFNHKGYELVDLLGKPFDDGLNVKARFIPSDELSTGERIISKIIKPQIDFNGMAIQIADIEVMTGE